MRGGDVRGVTTAPEVRAVVNPSSIETTDQFVADRMLSDISGQRMQRHAHRASVLGKQQDGQVRLNMANLVTQAQRFRIPLVIGDHDAVNRLMS